MSEKLNIKIDLSKASEKNPATTTSIAAAPPDVVYHYDRIIVALLVTIALLYAVYHFIFADHNHLSTTETPLQTEQTQKNTTDDVSQTQSELETKTRELNQVSHELTLPETDVAHTEESKASTTATDSFEKTVQPAQDQMALNTPVLESKPADHSIEFIEKSTLLAASEVPENAAPETTDIIDNIQADALQEPATTNKLDQVTLSQAENSPAAENTLALDNLKLEQSAADREIDIRLPGSSADIKAEEVLLPETAEAAKVSRPGLDDSHQAAPVSTAAISDKEMLPSTTAAVEILTDKLSRMQLTSNIYKKEPTDRLSSVILGNPEKATKIYLFTQLDNSKGSTIEHQWWYKGKMVSRRKFTAAGNRWRCYSSKNISKYRQGDWQIKVVDEDGKLLAQTAFEFKI